LQKSGDHPEMFVVSIDTCSGQTVAAGDTCAVTVDPEPTAPGAAGIHITIPDNSPIGCRSGNFYYQADYSYIGTFGAEPEPVRILDTRHGIGAPTHPVAAGQTITLQVGAAVDRDKQPRDRPRRDLRRLPVPADADL